MKITIAERFYPFSHTLGAKFLLPRSSLSVQVFPTRLQFLDLNHRIEPFFIDFSFVGPVKEFTVMLDLERGMLCVFGKTEQGYMRYLLQVEKDHIVLTMEKVPSEKVECRYGEQVVLLGKQGQLRIPLYFDDVAVASERLSLGMHKAQEWEAIYRRLDFKEIFPLWLRLAAWVPSQPVSYKEGNFLLLEECRQKVENCEKTHIIPAFERLFLCALEGVLTPRLFDSEYQGILPSSAASSSAVVSPLSLLTEGAKLIRSLFFCENQEEIAILPCLLGPFHCGRMVDVKTSQGNIVDFEWSKKNLRRMRIISSSSNDVRLKLPKGISSCRIKIGRKTIKNSSIDRDGRMTLFLNANEKAHLDRFN